MAAFLPNRNQLPANPPTPPEQRSFNGGGSQQQHNTPATQLRNGTRLQHRISGEYRGGGSFGPPNANGAPQPVPTVPHAHMPNGQARNMSGVGGAGAFEGPRSPPNTKSERNLD